MHGQAICAFPDTAPVVDAPHPHAPYRLTCALPSAMAPAAATGGHLRCPLRARLGALRKRRQPHATRLTSDPVSPRPTPKHRSVDLLQRSDIATNFTAAGRHLQKQLMN